MVKSEIVYPENKENNENNENLNKSFKHEARRLYLKYIEYESDYQIEIDKDVRQEIINLMEAKDQWDNHKINTKAIKQLNQ